MYKILRTILFFFPAEGVHHISMKALKVLCGWSWGQWLVTRACQPDDAEGLQRSVFGLSFRNPVGLGAGFDKNGLYLRELEALGFGSAEIGTVTPLPQAGNEQPRLFRLPQDQALINRMGFNNEGVEAIAARLKKWGKREAGAATKERGQPLIIGGNIGKNKLTPNGEAWKDYEICFRALFGEVD